MRIADLTWPEYHARIRTHLVVLPVGSMEPHGPHLPLGTDTLVVNYLADRLAQQVDALVFPPINYAVYADEARLGGTFPGMLGLSGHSLQEQIADVLTAAYNDGARRFLVLNGGYCSAGFVAEAIRTVLASVSGARAMTASWWHFASEESRNAIARETGTDRCDDHHAAMVETSLVMAMSPGSVRKELLSDDDSARRIRYQVYPLPPDLRTRTGVVYRVDQASPDIGSRLTEEIVTNMASAVQLELG